MNNILQYIRTHSTAILSTAVVMMKSGALGTGLSTFITALAGVLQSLPN